MDFYGFLDESESEDEEIIVVKPVNPVNSCIVM